MAIPASPAPTPMPACAPTERPLELASLELVDAAPADVAVVVAGILVRVAALPSVVVAAVFVDVVLVAVAVDDVEDSPTVALVSSSDA